MSKCLIALDKKRLLEILKMANLAQAHTGVELSWDT